METVGLNTNQAPARLSQRPGAEAAAPAGPQAQATQIIKAVTAVQESASARPTKENQDAKAVLNSVAAENARRSVQEYTDPIPAELSAAERSAAYAQLLGKSGDTSGEASKLFLTARNLFASE